MTAMCVVRDADGRWLAGRRAEWLATWAGRWALGAGGAVEVGENPAETLTRELEEEWQLVPERVSVEALAVMPSGLAALIGLATVAPGAEAVPDAEHDELAWWPADVDAWPGERPTTGCACSRAGSRPVDLALLARALRRRGAAVRARADGREVPAAAARLDAGGLEHHGPVLPGRAARRLPVQPPDEPASSPEARPHRRARDRRRVASHRGRRRCDAVVAPDAVAARPAGRHRGAAVLRARRQRPDAAALARRARPVLPVRRVERGELRRAARVPAAGGAAPVAARTRSRLGRGLRRRGRAHGGMCGSRRRACRRAGGGVEAARRRRRSSGGGGSRGWRSRSCRRA